MQSGLEHTLFAVLGEKASQPAFAYQRYCWDFGQAPQQIVLCADPVQLDSGIDQVILKPQRPELDADTAQQLQQHLNTHLQQDGWQLVFKHPQRWYLQALGEPRQALPQQTTPLSQTLGQSIFPLLPQGEHVYWHRLLNELQMLLHSSGQSAVNSLWLWGQADAEQQAITALNTSTVLTTNSETAQWAALAAQASCQTIAQLPSSLTQDTVVVLEDLLIASVSDDLQTWQDALERLEQDWLQPAYQAARAGKVQLSLTAADGYLWHCQALAWWQFWQRSKPSWERFI